MPPPPAVRRWRDVSASVPARRHSRSLLSSLPRRVHARTKSRRGISTVVAALSLVLVSLGLLRLLHRGEVVRSGVGGGGEDDGFLSSIEERRDNDNGDGDGAEAPYRFSLPRSTLEVPKDIAANGAERAGTMAMTVMTSTATATKTKTKTTKNKARSISSTYSAPLSLPRLRLRTMFHCRNPRFPPLLTSSGTTDVDDGGSDDNNNDDDDEDDDDRPVEPQLRSRDKIVFVHVFKTAGSTLREFFADYAQRCRAGWAVLIGCTRLHPESLPGYAAAGGGGGGGIQPNRGRVWTARKTGKVDRCQLKRSVERSGKLLELGTAVGGGGTKMTTTNSSVYPPPFHPVTNDALDRSYDMFGGHLPLGTGSVWPDVADLEGRPLARPDENGEEGSLTYVSFFRNAVNKYLSGVTYVISAEKPPKAVARIKNLLPMALADGRFQNKYADYLVTPQQRAADREKMEVEREGKSGGVGSVQPPSSEEQALRVMTNILRFEVVIGITERMSDSLKMLEALMDKDGAATDIFDKFGRERGGLSKPFKTEAAAEGKEEETEAKPAADGNRNGNGSGSGARKANISKLATSDLIDAITGEKDAPFLFRDVLEFTKYEQQITDFALALHLRQARSLGIG